EPQLVESPARPAAERANEPAPLKPAYAPEHAPRSLLGFWSLIVTQFQGAFSDNLLKNLVVLTALGTGLSRSQEHSLAEWITALFSFPFIIFSMAGGYLADRYSKRTVMLGVKIFEVAVMLFTLAGFALHHKGMLISGIFLM